MHREKEEKKIHPANRRKIPRNRSALKLFSFFKYQIHKFYMCAAKVTR